MSLRYYRVVDLDNRTGPVLEDLLNAQIAAGFMLQYVHRSSVTQVTFFRDCADESEWMALRTKDLAERDRRIKAAEEKRFAKAERKKNAATS